MDEVEGTDRWRPTRAGLIGLWRYWDETFTFHNGRLLLRGPNGSGKSMALELLLPFLLDGDSSPARLTSSGKQRGRLFDRLMTGSTDATRTGYAWVEFARGAEVFTVGARIRGSRATNKADVDLFTTSLAVGRDLRLLDSNRTPLSRRTLVEAIGNSGRVHDSVDEHRSAVRERLFPGFTAERYSSVVGALLALRKEKLSERLDPDKLSEVLSEALPPLDDHDIAAVAEGFERLDRRRAALVELERDAEEVRQLARRQRGYAQAVLVGAAAAVRSAESTRDAVTRSEREAREQLLQTEQRNDAVRGERDGLMRRADEIDIEVAALKDSEAYQAGAGLADLRIQATALRNVANREAARADELTRRHEAAGNDARTAAEACEAAEANARRAGDEMDARAAEVGAGQVVAEALAPGDADEAERLVGAWVRAQCHRVDEVRAALTAHDRAVTQRAVHDDQVTAAEHAMAGRAEAADGAERAETDARARYAAAVDDWASSCGTVGVQRLRDALPAPADEPGTVTAAVAQIRSVLAAEDAAGRERLNTERETADTALAAHRAERARWESSEIVEPDGPAWRSPREGLSGGPLWRLVDVAPGVTDSTVDGLEAALTAAGLLDAWVMPDGQVDLGPDRADLHLASRPRSGRTLAEVLVPAAGTGDVTAETVTAVLSSVPIADAASPDAPGAEVLIGIDRSFRLGSAHGRGPATPASLLGAVARERRRVQKLAEIDAAIADVERHLAALSRQAESLDRRRAAAHAELGGQPSGADVTAAVRAVADAQARLTQAQEALEAARTARRAAEEAVRTALRQLTTLAARHGLPADQDALAEVESALARLADATATWARRRREWVTAERGRDLAVAAQKLAHRDLVEAHLARDGAEREAAAVVHRVRTLEDSVGADYRQILDQIADLSRKRDAARARTRELSVEADELQRRVGELSGQVAAAEAQRAEAEQARDRSHRRFTAGLHALGVDAGAELEQSPDTATAVLAAARTLGAQYEKVDSSEHAVEQRSGQVADRLHQAQAALGARVDFDRELADDGWWVLRAAAGGLHRPIGELSEVLAGQLAQGRAELVEEEERLFEQTLAGSVRRALAERIRQASALVDGINIQLGAIKTAAAGVGVQLRWDVDPEQPPAVRSARALLLRDPADLRDEERTALQEFVRARVDQARAELEADAPWEARLRESLDYRAWHRFTLQIAHRDWDGYVPATGRRLQRLSTGERSIALHLPMIASVAAHYADESGMPAQCPRLILLDELFAGVDIPNRAQLFGAFTTWQLDAVFTSDHEWCQYADLDGIAIHYLHPPAGDEPVTSTRFTWDGRRRMIDPAA